MKIFKAYDIRGIYPDQLDEVLAEKIGYAIGRYLDTRSICVGRDVRVSAPSISKAIIKGINSSGTNAVDIGRCTTPMVYFTTANYQYGGGVMVTASHNPPEYIGLKISRENAIPIGQDSGLAEIQKLVPSDNIPANINNGISVTKQDVINDYLEHMISKAKINRNIKIAIDTANGAVGLIINDIIKALSLDVTPLFFEPDGMFPNHEPNPLKAETLVELKKTVKENNLEIGVAFDGDGDRCIFVDNEGNQVSSDLVTALFSSYFLPEEPGGSIIYDLRSSKIVPEEIQRLGGIPVRDRVGHAFMKKTLRDNNGIFGGELSGHFYFRDHFFCDSGVMAMIIMLNILSQEQKPLSELLKPLRKYFSTGEVNFEVEDKDGMIIKLAEIFKDAEIDFLDGITCQFKDWWFNVRKSNTEPLLRLNLEASSKELMEEKFDHLSKILSENI